MQRTCMYVCRTCVCKQRTCVCMAHLCMHAAHHVCMCRARARPGSNTVYALVLILWCLKRQALQWKVEPGPGPVLQWKVEPGPGPVLQWKVEPGPAPPHPFSSPARFQHCVCLSSYTKKARNYIQKVSCDQRGCQLCSIPVTLHNACCSFNLQRFI